MMFLLIILLLYVLIGGLLTYYAFKFRRYEEELDRLMWKRIEESEELKNWMNFFGRDFYWQCWLRVNIVVGVILWPWKYLIQRR